MNSKKVDDYELFLTNMTLVLMCKKIILKKPEFSECKVSMNGFITANLSTYLDFWFNHVPLSVDNECNPICCISEDNCYINKNGELVEAQTNGLVREVVATFKSCKQNEKIVPNAASLSHVISSLSNMFIKREIKSDDLVAWDQFYYPARISVLELIKANLENENHILKKTITK